MNAAWKAKLRQGIKASPYVIPVGAMILYWFVLVPFARLVKK